MAKSTEKGSKARAASVKQQVKPQPEPRRKEMKTKPPKKQVHRAAMKAVKPKQSKKSASSSSTRQESTAACVNRQIFQLSRGYAVVSGR